MKARGNGALWEAEKAKPRLSPLPTTLGNRMRDSHIPTGSTTILYTQTNRSRFAQLLPMSPV
jgi:hypothetical protein